MSTATSNQIRRERDDAACSPTASNKKQKYHESTFRQDGGDKVGATELASAFALASLASFSPGQNRNDPDAESRDAECGNDHIPISPETRSPIRRNRRVTWSRDTKEPRTQVARSVSFSPRTNRPLSRMPNGIPRPSSHRVQNLPPPVWAHRQSMATSQSAFRAPTSPYQPPVDKWICDFCNTAAFDTYEEACVHEGSCHVKRMMTSKHYIPPNNWWHGMHTPPQMKYLMPHERMHHPSPYTQNERTYTHINPSPRRCYHGSMSLAIPESDKDWLSPIDCFIRASCVEAISASEDTNSNPDRTKMQQVGIQCLFCRERSSDEKESAAVSYPSSVSDIYDSVKRWQNVHLEICRDVPAETKARLTQLRSTDAWNLSSGQYWADSAKRLGLIDTNEGIKFSVDPRGITFNSTSQNSPKIKDINHTITEENDSAKNESNKGISEGESIVSVDDIPMVPAYVYFLMRQVEGTHFTEADRFVARSKGPVGYPGFQCRHCHGHAGLGKYFPISSKSLSTNSTSQNIHSHLLKCRKVSPYVKDQLVALKDEKNKSPRLEPGWRRIFFDKIWDRLHNNASIN